MTDAAKEALLMNAALFKNFLPEEIDMFMMHNQFVSFSQGAMIIKQGEKQDILYVLLKGEVEVRVKMLGNGVVNVETLGAGHFLNEASFVSQCPAGISLVAKSPCECLMITQKYVDSINIFSQETTYKLLSIVAAQAGDRILYLHNKIINLMSTLDMVTRSFFGEVIKTLTTLSVINIHEVDYEIKQLRHASLFQAFSESEIDTILGLVSVVKAGKNCALIQSNDRHRDCYIVLCGAVQSSVVQKNKAAKLSVIGPMLFFCSLSAINQNIVGSIDFTTCENAILLKFSEESLIFLQEEHIDLWHKFYHLICNSIVLLEISMNKLDVRLNIETYNR